MHSGYFLNIDGGNGATFFFSAASYAAWRKSLEFYRAVSWRSTGKKLLLTGAYPLLKRRATLSPADIAAVVGRELGLAELPVIGKECSAMISPTRDKAIIHRHGFGYEKIAVGQSFAGIAVCMAGGQRPGRGERRPALRPEGDAFPLLAG